MQPLKQVITTLRREILMALEEDKQLPAGTRLEADRVVLLLNFSVQQKQAEDGSVALAFGVPQFGAEVSPQTHTLTIEFRPAGSVAQPASKGVDRPGAEVAVPNANAPELSSSEQALESLVSIFGAPGFDSSARATVFREALAGLSDDQARAIVNSLRGMPTPGITPAAARARGLINRLMEGAPAGPARSRDVLAEVFYRHSVQSLLRFVREKWKTQEEWLDEPVQRAGAGGGAPNRTKGERS